MTKLRTGHIIALILIIYMIISLIGINWGVPGRYQAELVLPVNIEPRKLFEQLAKARDKIYEIAEKNPTAYHGLLKQLGKLHSEVELLPERLETTNGNIPEPILHSLSSYLVRSKHPDEQNVLSAIAKMKPEKLDFNPHFFSYGGMYLYTVALFLKTASVLGFIQLTPDVKYYYANPEEMAKFFIVGRLTVIFAIFATLILIYVIAKKLYDKPTALLAMFLFTVSPLVLVKSHIMKPSFFALPFACLTFLFAQKILDSGRMKWYVLSGIFLGLTAGIAFNNFWVTGWIVILSHLLYSFRNNKKKITEILNKKIFLALVLSVLFFIVANPYIMVSAREFYEELIWMRGFNPLGFNLKIFFDFINIPLFYGLGPGLWILVILGLVFCFYTAYKGNKSDILIILYLVPTILFSCIISSATTSSPIFLRLLLMGMVILCITASRFTVTVWKAKRMVVPFIVVLISINLFLILGYAYNFWLDSTDKTNDITAGKWINTNIPVGSSIGITAPTPHVDQTPPFRFTDYVILSFTNVKELPTRKYLPEYFIIGENPADSLSINVASIWKEFNTHYEPIKYFNRGTKLLLWRFKSLLCSTNYPVAIYKLR